MQVVSINTIMDAYILILGVGILFVLYRAIQLYINRLIAPYIFRIQAEHTRQLELKVKLNDQVFKIKNLESRIDELLNSIEPKTPPTSTLRASGQNELSIVM